MISSTAPIVARSCGLTPAPGGVWASPQVSSCPLSEFGGGEEVAVCAKTLLGDNSRSPKIVGIAKNRLNMNVLVLWLVCGRTGSRRSRLEASELLLTATGERTIRHHVGASQPTMLRLPLEEVGPRA